jgi:hypothetical protein
MPAWIVVYAVWPFTDPDDDTYFVQGAGGGSVVGGLGTPVTGGVVTGVGYTAAGVWYAYVAGVWYVYATVVVIVRFPLILALPPLGFDTFTVLVPLGVPWGGWNTIYCVPTCH